MNTYSQNKEDLKIAEYFNGKVGNLLSVGENNGTELSNAKLLIELGWSGWLLEPASVFKQLEELHKGNDKVKCFNFGLANETGFVKFWESKNHVPNGTDLALVSSMDYSETKRWRDAGVEYEEKSIEVYTFSDFYEMVGKPEFNFISIDCEGADWQVLKQINLNQVKCSCLIIEWNGDKNLHKLYSDYCRQYSMYEYTKNAENIVYIYGNLC